MASSLSRDWKDLNDQLREADEEQCKKLLKDEQKGKNRRTFLLRIHSRLNKVRADKERQKLIGE